MVILYGHPESGHTYGGGNAHRLGRSRGWLFWEANRIGFSLPNLRRHLLMSKPA